MVLVKFVDVSIECQLEIWNELFYDSPLLHLL